MAIISLVFYLVCALPLFHATPLRKGGMVLYQSQPGFYNGNRAFIMQYASQPSSFMKRQAQASGVTAFVSGKKIAAGTYLKHAELIDDEQEQPLYDPQEGSVQSVANAYPGYESDDDIPKSDEADVNYPVADQPEVAPPTDVQTTSKDIAKNEDENNDEDDDNVPLRANNNRRASSNHYFPVSFGSTYGGAIAIANSYSAGKAGSATSTATAYGSSNKKSKKRVKQLN